MITCVRACAKAASAHACVVQHRRGRSARAGYGALCLRQLNTCVHTQTACTVRMALLQGPAGAVSLSAGQQAGVRASGPTLACARMAGMARLPTALKPVKNLPASIHLRACMHAARRQAGVPHRPSGHAHLKAPLP